MKGDQIRYWEGYKYQLETAYSCQTDLRPPEDIDHDFYSITIFGVVTGKKGYAWDGPSGPTFDTKDFMRGSLIHDILYQCIRHGLLHKDFREQADQELRKICREDGMSWFRAWYVFEAVRKFGGFWNSQPEKVFTAP